MEGYGVSGREIRRETYSVLCPGSREYLPARVDNCGIIRLLRRPAFAGHPRKDTGRGCFQGTPDQIIEPLHIFAVLVFV